MRYQRCLRLALVALFTLSNLGGPFSSRAPAISLQGSVSELETRLKLQYAAIEIEIAAPPSRIDHPSDYRDVLRAWQDRLASKFSEAAATAETLMQVDTAHTDVWRERMQTLRVYGKPISSPTERSVFGDGEVQKRAKVRRAPAATYTEEARADNVLGEVRLRLILSADGKVINIFPIKSLSHGLTESAMTAASRIEFEPAQRSGQMVSQFATFVYQFRKGDATPFIPRTVF